MGRASVLQGAAKVRGWARGARRRGETLARYAWHRAVGGAPQCKLCAGTTTPRVAYKRVFFECLGCGFLFSTDLDRVDLFERGMGFEGSWSGPAGGGYREEWLVERLHADLGLGRFLLYGTGATPTFATLLERGRDVVGCDISRDVVADKRRRHGEDRFFTPDELAAAGEFDVVVAVEVIEHFSDPLGSLRLLVETTGGEGIVCGTTNFRLGRAIVDGNTPGYMSLGDHVAYWSPSSLAHAAAQLGLAVKLFELVCPGSVKRDEKFGQLYPNKRVFFVYPDARFGAYFDKRAIDLPILPIDRP